MDWEKRARELLSDRERIRCMYQPSYWSDDLVEAMLKLGKEMADARAVEIRDAISVEALVHIESRLEYQTFHCAAKIAGDTIIKPKTREQRLEAALRKIALDDSWAASEARRALGSDR